ncbi:MAG: flagellar basal body-associated FliL family protein [Desulfobacterales bacterium]|jgi:flagellar FliL protein|nr:flagellar basal body-associated FliL family protein [Desulfobacterales bacterium]
MDRTEETLDIRAEEPQQEQPGKGNNKLIIIAGAILLLLVTGFLAYIMLYGEKEKAGTAAHKKEESLGKEVFVSLDPFVMNLAEQGRFLKLSMQFELTDKSYQPMVLDKTPKLRDAIIILISSKDSESISSPEGKFQLKDELLLRANQIIGEGVFKNLYFTEFVMQ